MNHSGMDAAINPHKNGSAVMAFVWNDGVTLGGEVLTARDTRRLRRGIIWLEIWLAEKQQYRNKPTI